jgi:urease accessory protein UreF
MKIATTRFLQLASPALPVGAYSYSQGLEWAIESGAVKDVASAKEWIEDHLRLVFSRFEVPTYVRAFEAWCKLEPLPLEGGGCPEGVGPAEGAGRNAVAVSTKGRDERELTEGDASFHSRVDEANAAPSPGASHHPPPRGGRGFGSAEVLKRLNDDFIASRESSEPRAETLQVGFSYAAWCREVAPINAAQRVVLENFSHVCAPVAAALAACASGLALRDGLLAYVFGFTENQAMVLAKALPLGQIASQKLLFALGDAVNECVDTAIDLSEEDWSSASPLLAIAQMKHETQYSRLFRS